MAIPTLLLGTYFLLLAHPINLVTADLGRHIKNGEYFVNNFEVIKTNFYSYSHPDFFTTNHHWGAGVLFYVLWAVFGFAGPHILFIALSLLTLFVFYKIARARAGLGLAVLAGILVMPLLAERTEVRPEVFSYLFSGLFFYFLLKYRSNKINFKKLLLLLLPLQLVWVNVHIYFILGPAIVLAFFAESIIRKKFANGKKYTLSVIALFAVSLINPFGLKGVTAPFTIFQNFGYRLVENQSVWFLDRVLPQPNLLIFKILFILLALSFIGVLVKNRKSWDPEAESSARASGQDWAVFFLALGFSAMAWLMLRNFTIFGLFALVIIAWNVNSVWGRFGQSPRDDGDNSVIARKSAQGGRRSNPRKTAAAAANARPRSDRLNYTALAIALLVFLLMVSGELARVYPYNPNFGFGVIRDNSASAEFFKANDIQGPIFNNYDIGGYLIYFLSPSPLAGEGARSDSRGADEGECCRVFVDNRPEAYPADFFENVYIPMQEDDKIWQEQLLEYDFNVIYFSHRDFTPWGQKFLSARVRDDDWAAVFADQWTLIFLRRNERNRKLIEEFEIPRTNFGVARAIDFHAY